MCGIAGIYDPINGLRPDDRLLVERMTQVIAHRGPDDSGCHVDGPVALGHRRLSVIDLSANGHQPMSNEDGTVWITYNGEVYNFAALKAKYGLASKGHQFRSHTDTEVLVHLYEELGVEMAKELDGMFAFTIWDSRKNELHLFRDRFGIKPLFYTNQGNRFLFGSEIKCILQDARVPRRVNLQALHDFLTFDYVPGPQTAFDGIHELPPAHRMTVSRAGTTMMRYWAPSYQIDEGLSESGAISKALEYLENAVSKQLVADVPVGVLLSGGMDSSTLAALMARHSSGPVHTYSIGFEDASFNELPFARMVSQAIGTKHREVVVTPALVREMLPKYLSYIDEPYADGSAIPTYYVCQLAKDEVTVVLSGEGGDEVFGGYDTYSAYEMACKFKRIPRWFRNGIISPIIHSLPVSDKKLSFEFKAKRFLGGMDLPPEKAHMWWRIVMVNAKGGAVVIGDDSIDDRSYLETLLQSQGYEVLLAEDGDEVLEVVADGNPVSLILLDLGLPDRGGLETLAEIRQRYNGVPAILTSAFPVSASVLDAIQLKKAVYLEKPILPEHLSGAIAQLLGPDAPRNVRNAAPQKVTKPSDISSFMRQIDTLITQVGGSEVPVLLQGETGVGKEVLAREIHNRSPRAKKPFIKVNCAALPTELVESELFGYERGAFTGAFQGSSGTLRDGARRHHSAR